MDEIIDMSEIDILSSVSLSKIYSISEIILKESNYDDDFYMIKEEIVRVFKVASGLKTILLMTVRDFFREQVLLTNDIKTATCISKAYDIICIDTIF